MPRETVVIALGGNSLLSAKEKFTIHNEIENVRDSCRVISQIIKAGYRVVITHGNGPQVGDMLLAQELAGERVPQMPLDVLGALTQGEIGYLIQRLLRRFLSSREIITMVTQVLVDPRDPGFRNPTKFVGPFYKSPPRSSGGSVFRRDSDRGYRRVVPSPEPLEIIERREIRKLVSQGFIVIACGGGGVPVFRRHGALEGAEAVIDKDLAAQKLANSLGAHMLLIITDVRRVATHFGKSLQKDLDKMTINEAEVYMMGGQFPPGSMGPKIEASMRFIRHGGRKAIITDREHALDALRGRDGTTITR
jgi:carbamate kinase